MHNHVPSDPFQQPAAASPPFPPAPPAHPPAAPPAYPGAAPQPYPAGWGGPPPAGGPGQPGYPFTPPQQPGTNGFAIAALLASILGGLGLGTIGGIVFGIIALRQIKRQPQRGRGLAITGLVFAGLHILFAVALVAFLVIDERRDTAAGIDDVAVTELKAGDCIRDFDGSVAIYDLPTVSCTDPHKAEVYHVYTFPAGSYPGRTQVEAESDKRCGAAFEPYLTPQTENMDIYYLYPRDSKEWRQDRSISCVVVAPSGTLTAPITK
ncbi:DUF4190 domain-containing protein [Actinoplanes flavus]|uniref:DUF4190 domain-containing protein n=1 Tax=Actinoplanes flavus TaxID=2820290 RepID=A0ABS3UDX8_9ACTN|nr:DUF4190 domain-containing protein [Actinoplanes flavus]MBO3735948.1 DUF4190 domain-containing protein [Actinoplanes flavus]